MRRGVHGRIADGVRAGRVTLAGRAERARAARTFVAEVLGPGTRAGMWPCCWSARSSVTVSGTPPRLLRGTVTVAVWAGDGVVRVEVSDRGGPGAPDLRLAARDAEGGRGLQLVAELAARWGWRRCGGQMVTWFEL